MSTKAAPRRTVLDDLGGRAAERPGQLWQVPTFFVGVVALVAVAFLTPFSRCHDAQRLEHDLATLRRGLAQADPDLERLLPLAEDLLGRSPQHPRSAGEIHFLVGTTYMRQADRSPAEQARDVRRQALAHLEQAEARGVSAQDKSRLCYRLGRVHYLSGDLQRAIDYLNRAPLSGEDAAEGYGLLVDAYLKSPGREIDAALRANQKQIDLSDDDAVVAAARVKRGELLLEKELRGEALKVLDGLSRRAPEELQWRARALQARCCQEDGLYNRAALLWQQLVTRPAAVQGGKGRALYMLGVCHELADPPETAQARKAFEEATHCGGEEAQAAALRLADSLLGGGHPEAALPHFQFALENVTVPKDYTNTLIDRAGACDMFEHGCTVYLQRHHYLSLELLAVAYRKIAAPGVAEERLAQAAEAVGRHLRDKAEKAKVKEPQEAAALFGRAREQFRKAAQAYEKAAQTQDRHADHLQRLARSADCLLQAQDYAAAVALFKRLTLDDVPVARRAEAWLGLAGALQAQGESAAARKAYEQCLYFRDTASADRACRQIAQEEVARGDLKKAEEILVGHLGGKDRVESQSLVLLADIHFKQGDYAKASVRYKEAIRLYPNSPHMLPTRDQLGECHRRLAEQALRESKADLGGAKKAYYLSIQRDRLGEALEVYQRLEYDLEARAQAGPLTTAEEALQRKALFVAADCLFDLGNSYGEVLRRYEDLAHRYQNRIEGLFACQRLWSCYNAIPEEVLKQRAHAVTVAAMTVALTYLPSIPEHDFDLYRAEGGDRQGWEVFLRVHLSELKSGRSEV